MSLFKFYERTAIFRKPEDIYIERDQEAAIRRELEVFCWSYGTDFSFTARQKRMTIGDRDFYLDILIAFRIFA